MANRTSTSVFPPSARSSYARIIGILGVTALVACGSNSSPPASEGGPQSVDWVASRMSTYATGATSWHATSRAAAHAVDLVGLDDARTQVYAATIETVDEGGARTVLLHQRAPVARELRLSGGHTTGTATRTEAMDALQGVLAASVDAAGLGSDFEVVTDGAATDDVTTRALPQDSSSLLEDAGPPLVDDGSTLIDPQATELLCSGSVADAVVTGSVALLGGTGTSSVSTYPASAAETLLDVADTDPGIADKAATALGAAQTSACDKSGKKPTLKQRCQKIVAQVGAVVLACGVVCTNGNGAPSDIADAVRDCREKAAEVNRRLEEEEQRRRQAAEDRDKNKFWSDFVQGCAEIGVMVLSGIGEAFKGSWSY